MCGCLSHVGMCPDWESNPWAFGSQAGIQSTEPHQPVPNTSFKPQNNHARQVFSFWDGEIEAQRGQVTCPRLDSYSVAELGFKPGQSGMLLEAVLGHRFDGGDDDDSNNNGS